MEQKLQIFDKDTLDFYNKATDEYLIHHGFDPAFDETRGSVCFVYKPMVLKPLVDKFAKTVSTIVGGGEYFLTFWSLCDYYTDSFLKPHRDRPSAEVSFTINMMQDGPNWPFYVSEKEYVCEPGEGVLYTYPNEHYRNKCPGNLYRQLMIHFVDQKGKFRKDRQVFSDMRNDGDTQVFYKNG